MKNAILALATLSLFACAAAPQEADATTTDAITSSASALRGAFEAYGDRYSVEVEIVSKQTVEHVIYCDADQGEGNRASAGSSAAPDFHEESGGTIRTVVRDAKGAVLGEASSTIRPFAVYATLDPEARCTPEGHVKDLSPTRHFDAVDPLVWVPGVIVETEKGQIWINPSYGGVASAAVSFRGTAAYRPLTTETTFGPRPFGGPGQEAILPVGELTFTPGERAVLEVGTNVQDEIARERRSVEIAR